ncbi:MAG: TIGR00159 family protein [Ruminococcaceae bacterium]|nr:TIGR00159 family protein [Oscillospiraceae bacterium]
MIDIFSVFIDKMASIFATYRPINDTLDILLIALVLFYGLKMVRDSRAFTFLKGIIILIVVYAVVSLCDMQASIWLFGKIFEFAIVILVIIFVPEIRKMLENMGNIKMFKSFFLKLVRSKALAAEHNEKVSVMINEICRAATELSDQKFGALVVFEKDSPLGEFIETGTILDASVTTELVVNIFFPKSPLHDGAAIIRDKKLYAAGCILPLTNKYDIASDLGTRHRAAIGMSEQSDAMVLVVSEETGDISIAKDGKLERDISVGKVREILLDFLTIPIEEKNGGKNGGKKNA